MSEEKEKLDHMINFRATEEMYKDLIKYLEIAGKTISTVMRQATFDYLKLQRSIKKNGYGKSKPIKEKKVEVKTITPPEGAMYCDSDHCELPPDYLKQNKKLLK